MLVFRGEMTRGEKTTTGKPPFLPISDRHSLKVGDAISCCHGFLDTGITLVITSHPTRPVPVSVRFLFPPQ